jgi:hypothetical protein
MHPRKSLKPLAASAMLVTAGAVAAVNIATPPTASADAVAFLVNVTVRPGYNFPNGDSALAYGHGVCDKVAARELSATPWATSRTTSTPPTTTRPRI